MIYVAGACTVVSIVCVLCVHVLLCIRSACRAHSSWAHFHFLESFFAVAGPPGVMLFSRMDSLCNAVTDWASDFGCALRSMPTGQFIASLARSGRHRSEVLETPGERMTWGFGYITGGLSTCAHCPHPHLAGAACCAGCHPHVAGVACAVGACRGAAVVHWFSFQACANAVDPRSRIKEEMLQDASVQWGRQIKG